jgi:hypothetical protein
MMRLTFTCLRCNAMFWSAAAVLVLSSSVGSCGIYSPYGAQTGGARTFSVDYFTPVASLASPAVAQRFTEALKDVVQRQSTLRWESTGGELHFSGRIVGYEVTTSAVSGGESETATQNRLTVQVQVVYNNALDAELNFERTFSKFADFPADRNLFDVEEELTEQINEQLVQEVFNASLGNW